MGQHSINLFDMTYMTTRDGKEEKVNHYLFFKKLGHQAALYSSSRLPLVLGVGWFLASLFFYCNVFDEW